MGHTAADMGYFEHLPVSYADDPKQTFPLIIYNNGWGSERAFGKPEDELSVYANTDMFQVIHEGQWDDTRPFVVLSPQRCSVQLADVELNRIKYFVDFAVNTYKVDPTRIYMVGMSAGAYYTWEYIRLNPTQLAAVVPISCGGSTLAADGCVMKQTPAWAFHAKDDPIVPYTASLATVQTINACQPTERVRYTLYPTGGHDPMPTLDMSGLGKGDPSYYIYDPESIHGCFSTRGSEVRSLSTVKAIVRPDEATAAGCSNSDVPRSTWEVWSILARIQALHLCPCSGIQ